MSKVWLITGSSRGLGRSIAEAVLAHGDQLVATARNPEQLAGLKQQYGNAVLTVALDVRKMDQAQAAVQAAVETFGRLDVVVNNAGYGNVAAIEEASEEEFRDQIETNLWGVINVTRAALPILRKQRSGYFLQISSVGGRIGGPGLGAYQTSKWAMEGFSEVLAKEAMPFGVKVVIVEPGGMATDWAGSSMHITEPGEDYKASVGWMLELIQQHKKAEALTGSSAGSDIGKVAQVLLKIVDEPDPPLRLLMGSDAFQYALANDEARLVETKRWETVTRSTDAT